MSNLKLIGVDESTAASLMAIVSHRTGIPLDHLAFRSITQMTLPEKVEDVKEDDTYTLMSLVSGHSGIPLEYLKFKSIRHID